MPRSKRSAKLETRTARLSLPVGKRNSEPIQEGRYIIYQRPKNKAAGSWLARWFDLDTKKQKQERLGVADDYTDADGTTTLSWTQAQDKAKAWFDKQDQIARMEAGGEVIHQGPFTVNAALDLYFEDGERRGVKGLGRDKQRAEAWIRPELGQLEVTGLTRGRIESWMAKIAESPRRVRKAKAKAPGAQMPTPRNFKTPRVPKPAPAAPAPPSTDDEKRARKDSTNRILTVLKAALTHALDRRMVINGDAWQTVKPYRETTKARLRFLSAAEHVRLVNACTDDFRNLVRGALLTGARYSELAHMRVEDFNAKTAKVFIAESKSGKPRHVTLTNDGKTLFEGLTAGREAGALVFLQSGKTRRNREAMGDSWGASDASRLMAEACKAAKVKPLTFHELRHSYASMLVNQGCPLIYVASQFGHSDTRMVEKHYGHLAPSAMADAIRAALPSIGLMDQPKVAELEIVGTQVHDGFNDSRTPDIPPSFDVRFGLFSG